MREHRLYQADWLMRFYGFAQPEILAGTADGMLDLDIDPKLAWALRNRGVFPVDVNRADREALLRVPGLGVKARGAHPANASVSPPATGGCRPALPVDFQGAALHRRAKAGRPAA